jgi:uncharacterized integral membrane protein
MQMRHLKLLGVAILALCIVLLVIQNREPMVVKMLFFRFAAPAALVLFATAVVGFLIGLAAAFLILRRGGSGPPRPRAPA